MEHESIRQRILHYLMRIFYVKRLTEGNEPHVLKTFLGSILTRPYTLLLKILYEENRLVFTLRHYRQWVLLSYKPQYQFMKMGDDIGGIFLRLPICNTKGCHA